MAPCMLAIVYMEVLRGLWGRAKPYAPTERVYDDCEPKYVQGVERRLFQQIRQLLAM